MIRNEEFARKILKHFDKEISDLPASTKSHNNIRNGLRKHLENVFEVAKKYFPEDNLLHFMALVHDLGKARSYYWDKEPKHVKPDIDHHFNTIVMLYEYGIKLTREELNAIQFHHGDFSPFKGEKTKLAIKLHFCDMMAVEKEVTK